MTLIALAFLFAIAALLGTAGPTAANEIRHGRGAFLELAAQRAADGVLADWYESSWVDSAVGRPPGTVVSFLPDSTAPGIVSTRVLEGVGPGLWMLQVRSVVAGPGGAIRTLALRGWLVRVDTLPGDSIPRTRPIARSRVGAFQ